MTVYDDVDLEDMEWSHALTAYTYECPCGDVFQITMADLRNGEDIAKCPSCTLVVRVIYDESDFDDPAEPAAGEIPQTLKCLVPSH